MRKVYLLFLLLFGLQKSFAQTNTFPTSGNVGIGTNSPAYLLDVNSASQRLYNLTGATILRIEGNGAANYAGSYIYLSAGTPRIGDTFTKVRIDANRGTDSTSIFQYSRMNGDTYTGIFYQYGDLVGHRFFTPASRTATSTSEVFRISSDGRVGIGSTTLTNRGLALATPITGGTTSYGMLNNGLVKSDVTAGAYLNYSQLNTQATSFTLPAAVHFLASEGTIGAGSSVTSQIGFWVSSNMTSAGNNFGYRSAIPIGTNNWNLYLEGAANNFMAGALGVGTTSLVGNNLRVSKTITGATTSIGVRSDGQIQPDVTGAAYYYRSDASTAASTATNSVTHYFANQSVLGSGSTVDNQTGFSVGSSLISATNNYGFYGNIGAGTGRWNLYMGGNANNYLEGNLGVGVTSPNAPLQFENALANRIIVLNEGANNDHQFYGLGINSSMLRFQIAGTTGAYGFYAGTSASASNEVARITGTGRLGIGTTAPISAIHLSGATGNSIISLQRPGNPASSAIGAIGFMNGANNYVSGVTSTYGADSTQAYLSLRVGTANANVYSVPEKMRIDKDGNVGIGTTNPQSKLEVSGATNTSGLRFTNLTSASTTSASNGKVLTVNSTGDVVLADNGGSMETSDLNTYKTYYTESLMANATTPRRYEIARIFTDVAAWSATSPIEIELDEIYYGTGVKRKYQVLFGYPDSYKLIQTDIYTAGATTHNNFQLTVGTPEVISGTIKYLPIYVDLRNYGRVRALIKTGRALNASSTTGTGGTVYIDTNPTPTTIAEFTADNTVSFANGAATTLLTGNVGIGVAAPTKRLELGGTRPTVFDSNNGTIKMKGDVGGWAMNYGFKGSSDTDWGGLWGLGGADALTQWSIGKAYTDNFLVVKSTGFVGIGTSTPSSELHVNGDITLSSDGVTASSIKPSVNVNGTTRTLRFDYGSSSASEGFQFYNSNSSTSLMMIQGGGNVGIGVTAPASKLHVANNATGINAVQTIETIGTGGRPYALFKAEGANYGYVGYGHTGTDAMSVFNYRNAGLNFGTNSATRMSIDNSGGVMIGTTTSNGSLLVKGNGGVMTLEGSDHSYMQFYPQTYAGGRKGYLGFPNANSNILMLTNEFTNGSIRMRNNNIDAISINSAGQVGINTLTIPTDYKLAVAGNIIAEKVKVKKQSSGWPDYVFNEEYKLPSLKEIEQFTKENKHLPEIPSAKEIEKEGQDIGDMNRLLLKKVEELTLYVIELKKDNERQDLEIKQLKKHKK